MFFKLIDDQLQKSATVKEQANHVSNNFTGKTHVGKRFMKLNKLLYLLRWNVSIFRQTRIKYELYKCLILP